MFLRSVPQSLLLPRPSTLFRTVISLIQRTQCLNPTGGRYLSTNGQPRTRSSQEIAVAPHPTLRHSNGTARPPQRHRHRGTEASILFGDESSSSDHSDLDSSVSPLPGCLPTPTCSPHSTGSARSQETSSSVPETRYAVAPSVFGKEEYNSAKTRRPEPIAATVQQQAGSVIQ
ncbi:tonsoku-like protein [Salmo trutta]|uniref:tonsoku-like protein n=1 Tax=Salmo trutta TaxID=8032 RepID=UPI0011300BAE|nr:tonsoku-like protein [Salmo trutta]